MPPRYSEFPRFPVIGGTSLLAIGVTIAYMAQADVSPLFETPMIRHGEYWRLLTCILPHDGVMHIVFDAYWFWVLGTAVEETFGHFRTMLLVIMLGVGSSAFEFAFLEGGIGLSGVVYGLFGLIWVLGQYDERFSDIIDRRTTLIFVGWFFFCIVLTVMNLMPIANIAHGTGMMLGVLVGFATVDNPYRKLSFLCLMVFFCFGVWGATVGRPKVNLSRSGGLAEGRWGYEALVSGHDDQAVRWFKDATEYRPRVAGYWYDLGIAQARMKLTSDSLDSFQHGADLGDPACATAIANMYDTGKFGLPKDEAKAIVWYRRAVDAGDPDAENSLAWIYSSSTDPAVRNPVAALDLAKKAVGASKDEPDAARLDTLAQAYFVNRQYDEAIKAENEALTVAAPDDVKDFKERLNKYQNAALLEKNTSQKKTSSTHTR